MGVGAGGGAGGRRPGSGGWDYQLAERAPDNAGEGQVGVWLKGGRSGRGGEGRDVCSLAWTSAWLGLGTPLLRGAPGAGPGRGRGGGAESREPRGPSRAAVGRPPLSRSVQLEAMRMFLTSAGLN